MIDNELESTEPRPLLKDNEAVHSEVFALPANLHAQFEAAMKPHGDIQEQLKTLRLAKHPISGHVTSNQAISSPQELGKIIRSRRTANGMNQQQLADLAGVGRRFLSELENGKQSLEFGKVLKVASAIGIDLIAKQK
jgi:y4mF family transcriptional regulator